MAAVVAEADLISNGLTIVFLPDTGFLIKTRFVLDDLVTVGDKANCGVSCGVNWF